jgi:soluble lytic murein transglycosylase-like protein
MISNTLLAIDSTRPCGYPVPTWDNRLMLIHKLVGFMVLSWTVLALAPSALADIYMYKDRNGVVTFTNVPNHTAYRRVLRSANNPLPASGQANASYDHLILTASGRHSVDADLVRAVIKTESDFNTAARSNKGAMGLMQLMPDTARLHNVADAYDPGENVEGGVRHLRMLLDRYQGNLELSLAAYNAGSGAVEKYRGIPPFAETKEYVRRVLRFYDSYRGEGLQAVNSVRQ